MRQVCLFFSKKNKSNRCPDHQARFAFGRRWRWSASHFYSPAYCTCCMWSCKLAKDSDFPLNVLTGPVLYLYSRSQDGRDAAIVMPRPFVLSRTGRTCIFLGAHLILILQTRSDFNVGYCCVYTWSGAPAYPGRRRRFVAHGSVQCARRTTRKNG